MLEDYVYRNIKLYGNALIDEETYIKYGPRKILKDLKSHGFKCVIRIFKIKSKDSTNPLHKKIVTEKTFIIQEV